MDREWGLLLKVEVGPDEAAPDAETLDALLASLEGGDKRLTGGGRDFTVAWWVEAPDAAAATRLGAENLRRAAASLGLRDLRFIRTHAASVEGRSPTSRDRRPPAETSGTWSVDFKASMPAGGQPADEATLEQVRDALADLDAEVTFHGDLEKFLLDDGSGFTVRFWATGVTMEAALGSARDRLLAVLRQIGLGDWNLVRLKAWSAADLQADLFPGAADRVTHQTGELR